MEKLIEGNAYLFGDNIDTDQIYPGRYLALTDKNEIAVHALEELRPGFAKLHAEGSILVVGRNFGCGSSREHAVITLKEAGVKMVVASSFARIFFRNAINLGLPVLTCNESVKIAFETEELVVNLLTGKILNKNNNIEFQGELLPGFILDILNSGGIKRLYKKTYSGDDRSILV